MTADLTAGKGLGATAADLQALLRTRWDDPGVRVESLEPFGDGHSGFTYLAQLASRRARGRHVVRLSPPGARIAGSADVGRQGRIMAALHATGLPTPRVLLADSTGALDGRAVVVMELLSGTDWRDAARAHGDRWVADAAVDVLHRLAHVRPQEAGLAGEPVLTVAEDLERWSRLLERAPEHLHADGARLAAALGATLPVTSRSGLVHGDFHVGNLVFGDERVVGILDWEIAGLGDPRWDLGSLAVAAIRRKYRPEPNPTGDLEVPVTVLQERYGEAPAQTTWFVAASCFKYVAILGYNLGLHLRGRRLDPVYERMPDTISGLATDGLRWLDAGPSST